MLLFGFARRSITTQEEGEQLFTKPGSVTAIAAQLRRLGKAKALSDGKTLHKHIQARGMDVFTFVGNCLIEMYTNCGSLHDAVAAFDRLPNPNVYSFNMLIKAYCQNGSAMDAFQVFTNMPLKDTVSWNAMIAAFSQSGRGRHALNLYSRMKLEGFTPNGVTFTCTLDACAQLAHLIEGQEIHGLVVGLGFEQDVLVGTALVNMYGKCKSCHDAMCVFHGLCNHDIVAWNAMISVFSEVGHRKEIVLYFLRMLADGIEPDNVTYVSVLETCALEEGHVLHMVILESIYDQDVEVYTALFAMYGRYGSLDDAMHVFLRMPSRTTVSWNAMIAMLIRNRHSKVALALYKRMRLEGCQPDKSTFTSVVDACASIAALDEGQDVHATIICCQHEQDTPICNALVSLYGDCGSMREARKVFDGLPCKDVVSWTAIITGAVQNGHDGDALYLFHRMQVEGFKPDGITFVSVLTACGRSGRVDEGEHVFISMNRDYEITLSREHYLCLVYLLGRAGQLNVAELMAENMPLENMGMVWLSLLGACNIHGNAQQAFRAAQSCIEYVPENVASYVLLSNIHAASQYYQVVD